MHWTSNTLTTAFKRKRDLDQFAQAFQKHITTVSVPAGTRGHRGDRPARTGKWPRRNFTSYYMLGFDHLNPEQIGQLGAEMSDLADQVTEDDRAVYEVWFHDDEVHVGFEHEEDRDEFAEILDEAAGDDEIQITDEPPPVDASPRQILVR